MSHGLPSEGTRRLQLGLGWLAVGCCLLAYAVTLVLHGPPFWAGWWVVMLAVLAGAFFAARLLTGPVEWVLAGYRGG
jgi:hypothetical protein